MNSTSMIFLPVLQFIGIFIILIAATLWLRYRQVLSVSHSGTFSLLLTDLVMPAMIFHKMSGVKINLQELDAAAAMLSAEIFVGLLAWWIGSRLLRLDHGSLGVFIIASTFGSTTQLGNALVQVVYPDDIQIKAEAVMVGQMGVGMPNNTVGGMIAMFFGAGNEGLSRNYLLKAFLENPCFLAFISGMLWSTFNLPRTGFVLTPIFEAFKLVGDSLPFLVAVLTGLVFKPISLKDMGWTFITCMFLLLVFQPILTKQLDAFMGVTSLNTQILLLLAAMPASPLAVAFATRYGGNVELASSLVIGSCIVSAITLPFLVYFFG